MNDSRGAPTTRILALALLAVAACSAEPEGATAQAPAGEDLLKAASEARAKGSLEAPVTVFELADFECPFCSRFAVEVQPRIAQEYIETGKVQWVFVNYPLPMHQKAWLASEAAMCVGGTGGDFWAMHDALFENQASWSDADDAGSMFAGWAEAAGADAAAYGDCVAADRVAALLTQDLMSSAQTGATGTPAFIVNQREMVAGLKSYEEWKGILDKALADAAADAAGAAADTAGGPPEGGSGGGS